MRIAAYIHIFRSRLDANPTGVTKHIAGIVPGLARTPQMEVEVLCTREGLNPDGSLPAGSCLHGIPIRTIGWKRKLVETGWTFLRWPAAERWAGPIDWVYAPVDAFVATRRAKLAVTIHCVNWFEPELPWYQHPDTVRYRRFNITRYRQIFKHAELILPVSEFLGQRITALFGVEPNRMRVVGNGIEDAYFQPGRLDERWQSVTAGRPFVVVVGGLSRRKGADCILAVAKDLVRRNSDLLILVAGSGETMFDEPAAAIPNIRFIGYVGVDSGLPELLSASTALLFPSRYETFGIPAGEAMAAGTPAIVSHFAALPEVVGDAGIIVDPQRPAEIAEVIDKLARDPALRGKYVEAGRNRAKDHRWQTCLNRLVAALKEFNAT